MRRRMILWEGISRIDNVSPLVVLATYDTRADRASVNRKTGSMIQTWILRADVDPVAAKREGIDTAICGDCSHRSSASGGSDACYVNVGQAPLSTFRAYQRDGTRVTRAGNPTTRGDSIPFDLDAFNGRLVRFGSYGDPAAAPIELWEDIAGVASGVTGYTHQWRDADPRFAAFCMASVDDTRD